MPRPTQPPRSTGFIHGARPEDLCEECELPCGFAACGVTCHRRHFLAGLLRCSYLYRGYCFLVDVPGCAFDNGGRTESQWLPLLNSWLHSRTRADESEDFRLARLRTEEYLNEQIEAQNVFLCRYLEEVYNLALSSGGSFVEEELTHLESGLLKLLSGTSRKL
ncbi:MAG: hypothetical protein ACYDIE_07605 [Candidatus Krumholzibacteriia bacterium]